VRIGAPVRIGLLACVAFACKTKAPSVPADAPPAPTVDEETDGPPERGDEGDDAPMPKGASIPRGDGSPRALLAEVERELSSMRSSAYSHHTAIDESAGVYDYDCSGFVDYALQGAASAAYAELCFASVPRPLAKHFQAFFAGLPPDRPRGHWQAVPRVADIRPGDVIAWLRPADSVSKNTGHVVIAHGAPLPDEEGPDAFVIPVVDSTSVRHGRGDSRLESKSTGLGTGTLVVFADSSGAPIGYRWSLGKKARKHTSPFGVGRLVP
jgi:hypothetical protein